MSTWILPLMILIAAVAIAWPLSWYMQFVFDPNNKSPIMRRWQQGLEVVLGRNNANTTVTWAAYGRSMLMFNYCMFVLVFLVLSFQDYLPLNPDGKPSLEPTLAFNTALARRKLAWLFELLIAPEPITHYRCLAPYLPHQHASHPIRRLRPDWGERTAYNPWRTASIHI